MSHDARGGKPVSGELIPVLWICGPAGAGKTTVGWEIYAQLALAGIKAGYVDIDQLGNFSPDPAADPGRYRMQAENLGAVLAAFLAAGARCAIVSGVVDPAHGVYVDTIPQAALTVCRLRADAAELERRLAGREWPADLVAESLRDAGLTGAYVDLDQIGFCNAAPPGDPSNHRLKARILAALRQTFRAAGAQCLTMVGPAEDEAAVQVYARALPAAAITVCRLHAGRNELTRRIMLRGQGGGWDQPGDPLTGRPAAHLRAVADAAAADADLLERSALGDLRIDTDGRTAQKCVEAILAQSGWLARLAPDAP